MTRYIDTSEVNKDLIQKMIDTISADPGAFDQSKWGAVFTEPDYECHTPCCLAGLAVVLGDQSALRRHDDVARAAEELLNLDTMKLRAYIWTDRWPREWRKERLPGERYHERPSAEDAIFVLQAILDGTLEDHYGE